MEIKVKFDLEHLESEILEIEKNVMINKDLNFVFALPINYINF